MTYYPHHDRVVTALSRIILRRSPRVLYKWQGAVVYHIYKCNHFVYHDQRESSSERYFLYLPFFTIGAFALGRGENKTRGKKTRSSSVAAFHWPKQFSSVAAFHWPADISLVEGPADKWVVEGAYPPPRRELGGVLCQT